jgi:hypothetical protein
MSGVCTSVRQTGEFVHAYDRIGEVMVYIEPVNGEKVG